MPGEPRQTATAGSGPRRGGLEAAAGATAEPTHSSPYRASGARFAGSASAFQVAGCTRITLPCTHPAPYPSTPPVGPYRCRTHCRVQYGSLGACTYDRSGPVLGEPRGAEYTAVSGSQAGLYRFMRFARPFDCNSTSFSHVLLSLVPVLLRLVPVLLRLVPVLLILGPCFTEFRTCFTTRTLSQPEARICLVS